MTPQAIDRIMKATFEKLTEKPPVGACRCKDRKSAVIVAPYLAPLVEGGNAANALILVSCRSCGVSIPYVGEFLFGEDEWRRMLKS